MTIRDANPLRMPRRVHEGERPSASRENHLRDVVHRIQQLKNEIVLLRPRPWAERMLHRITEIHRDYLVAKRVWRNDTDGLEDVYIAKPPLLRAVASHDGVTYTGYGPEGQTRTATKGPDSETQTVRPKYLIGDVIEVTVKRGLTGIPEVDGQRGRPVDDNVDGRAWARDPT